MDTTPLRQYTVLHKEDLTGDAAYLRAALDTLETLVVSSGLAAGSPEDSELLIYCHAFSDVKLDLVDLAELPLPQALRVVLLLRAVTPRSSRLTRPEHFENPGTGVSFLALDPVRGVSARLQQLLGKPTSRRSRPHRVPLPPELKSDQIAELTEHSLGLRPQRLRAEIRDAFESRGFKYLDLLADAVGRRLESGTRGVLEACYLLTNDYSASRHSLHADMAKPYSASAAGVGDTCKRIRFLEHWVDLRHAVASAQAHATKLQEFKVLILDDNPGEAFKELNALVAKHLLRSHQPPTISSPFDLGVSDRSLRWLANYQALKRTTGGRKANGRAAVELGELAELLNRTADADVVLVDQFIRMQSGQEEMLGAQLIRGLRRLLRDLGKHVPEFVALSRTDDPQVIQQALRAGAREYVLKSRFVSLPAVLAKLSSRAVAKSPHRNFRELYTLPAETIGLLRSAKLPAVAYHDITSTAAALPQDIAPVDPTLADWMSLLGEIPKPDLHVHAGSVMSREFLALAALVMLVRPRGVGCDVKPLLTSEAQHIQELVALLHSILDSESSSSLSVEFSHSGLQGAPAEMPLTALGGADGPNVGPGRWIDHWGSIARVHVIRCLEASLPAKIVRELRATLHSELGVRDHLDVKEAVRTIEKKSHLELAMFLVRHAQTITIGSHAFKLGLVDWRLDDLIRVYLLVLASRYSAASVQATCAEGRDRKPHDLLDLFRRRDGASGSPSLDDHVHALSRLLYDPDPNQGRLASTAFRRSGWIWSDEWNEWPPIRVTLGWTPKRPEDCQPINFNEDPIGFTLATGTRCENLKEYLLGCEFAGAEHLRHPFLIHVYCRQVIFDWIEQGIVYTELKASPDGYVYPEIEFDYGAVAQCFVAAFSGAQREALAVYRGSLEPREWAAVSLGERYQLDKLRWLMGCEGDGATESPYSVRKRLPCKVSLVLVGKRHKALREMILEAAAAAVLRPTGDSPVQSPAEFVDQEFGTCRVVGFDLAGPEDGHPPGAYAAEFGRLGRLHVPITVHAGENAGPQFIEDAILALGAVRIGHGLSLAEDRRLIARVRDERIAIELCPVCNHQTSRFHAPRSDGTTPRRAYPLEDYLRSGLYVSINTDNPIISDTNILREYFQASYAMPGRLTLWEALRLVRMGLVMSFLPLHERKHLLSLVGEYIFDLLSDEAAVQRLRFLVASQQESL